MNQIFFKMTNFNKMQRNVKIMNDDDSILLVLMNYVQILKLGSDAWFCKCTTSLSLFRHYGSNQFSPTRTTTTLALFLKICITKTVKSCPYLHCQSVTHIIIKLRSHNQRASLLSVEEKNKNHRNSKILFCPFNCEFRSSIYLANASFSQVLSKQYCIFKVFLLFVFVCVYSKLLIFILILLDFSNLHQYLGNISFPILWFYI